MIGFPFHDWSTETRFKFLFFDSNEWWTRDFAFYQLSSHRRVGNVKSVGEACQQLQYPFNQTFLLKGRWSSSNVVEEFWWSWRESSSFLSRPIPWSLNSYAQLANETSSYIKKGFNRKLWWGTTQRRWEALKMFETCLCFSTFQTFWGLVIILKWLLIDKNLKFKREPRC